MNYLYILTDSYRSRLCVMWLNCGGKDIIQNSPLGQNCFVLHAFFISTSSSNFHLSIVVLVLNHLPKLRLKWCLAGALLELKVNYFLYKYISYLLILSCLCLCITVPPQKQWVWPKNLPRLRMFVHVCKTSTFFSLASQLSFSRSVHAPKPHLDSKRVKVIFFAI